MNVTVEDLGPCRKLLRVEVESATVDATFEEITTEFQRHAQLPGFRQGKAPRHLITKNFSKRIEEEVKRKLISEHYEKAVKEKNLKILSYPEVEEVQFGPGVPLQFAATVEIFPEFEVPEYKGIPLKKETASVTPEDIDRALTMLREQQVSYADVQRPAQFGDYAVVNYTGTSDGKPLTEFSPTAKGLTEQKKFWLNIAPGSFIPGFTEQLVGMQAGEKRMVTVTFPADFVAPQLSGMKGEYEVEVVTIKEKRLPEVSDLFAKSFGAENVEALRAGIARDLQNELDFKQERSLRNQVVGTLLQRVSFDLPESIVQQETRNVVYDIVRENQNRGATKEMIEQQKQEIYQVANNSAKERVKASLVLQKIAEKEGIKVEKEELAYRIAVLAQQAGVKPEKLAQQLRERDGFAEIHEQILTRKTLDFLVKEAQVEEILSPPPGPAEPAAEQNPS